MRPLIHVLLGFLLAGCLAAACSGPKEESDVLPSDAAVDVDARDVPEECPAGLVPWPGGGCAPRVDECPNPWELPLIGGGCVAIGPRACPKLWDPESDVDCEPGQLMEYDGNACPEGFVLTDDEVACIPFFEENCGDMEIPVLGGGCKKVGPEWYDPEAPNGGLDLPYFDECPPGEKAVFGGGCERVVPPVAGCPAGPFPAVPDGAVNVVYVSAASTCQDGCGTAEAPFATVGEATASVAEGGYILIGPGNYEEGVLIEKPLHVLGLCASLVTVSGWATLPGDKPKVPKAGVAISGTKGAEVSGLRVTSSAVGVAVLASKEVTLEQMELSGVAGLGIYVGPGSQVIVDRLWLHDTVASQEKVWMSGYGIWTADGGQTTVSASLLDSVRGAGVYATGAGTSAALTDSEVRGTQLLGSGTMGAGAQAADEAKVSVVRTLFSSNSSFGFLAAGGASLAATDALVRDTKPDATGQYGTGLMAASGAAATLSRCLLDENTWLGAAVFDSGSQVELSSTAVRDTKPDHNGKFGMGIQALDGATAKVSGSLFEGNTGMGVGAGLPGTHLELAGSVVRATKQNKTGNNGHGLEVGDKATATVSGCLFEGNNQLGILVRDSDTEVILSDTIVRDTKLDEDMEAGHGLAVSGGAGAIVSDCLFEGNAVLGIAARDVGTHVALSGAVLRNMKLWGMQAMEGTAVTVSGCLFERNTGIGVAVRDSGTLVHITDSVVRDTQQGHDVEGDYEVQIQVSRGAAATLSDCLIKRNRGAAIFIAHAGTQASLSGTIVPQVAPDGSEQTSDYALQASEGAAATVSGCLFSGNTNAALALFDSGTQVQLLGTVVRDTKPSAKGLMGDGLVALGGAKSTAMMCLFESETTRGVTAFGAATTVKLDACAVLDTLAGGGTVQTATGEEFQVFGDGVLAAEGSKLELESTLVSGNARNGIYFNQSFGSMTNSVIVGNDFYGLAMEECADQVDWEGQGNYILGNAKALPPDKAAQVTTSTGGMAVPPAPEMMAVPTRSVE